MRPTRARGVTHYIRRPLGKAHAWQPQHMIATQNLLELHHTHIVELCGPSRAALKDYTHRGAQRPRKQSRPTAVVGAPLGGRSGFATAACGARRVAVRDVWTAMGNRSAQQELIPTGFAFQRAAGGACVGLMERSIFTGGASVNLSHQLVSPSLAMHYLIVGHIACEACLIDAPRRCWSRCPGFVPTCCEQGRA